MRMPPLTEFSRGSVLSNVSFRQLTTSRKKLKWKNDARPAVGFFWLESMSKWCQKPGQTQAVVAKIQNESWAEHMVLLSSGENQMVLSFHAFDEANFSPAQQLSVQWPRPCTQKLKDVGKTVLLQPGRIFSALRSAFLSVTLTVRGSASACVCYLCVMISVLSYNGWEWLILLLHHALASGVPHGSLLGPTFVEVGFTRCSQGTAGLIGRWGYHWFIQFHHDDTKWRNINEGFLSEGPGIVCEAALLPLATYWFASPEEQLVSCQGEVAGFPALDELPAHLFLLQLPLNQRLPLLVHN